MPDEGSAGRDRDAGVDPDHDVERDPNLAREARDVDPQDTPRDRSGLPVANAGEIAPKVPGIDKATVRKRLEIFTANCRSAPAATTRSTRSGSPSKTSTPPANGGRR